MRRAIALPDSFGRAAHLARLARGARGFLEAPLSRAGAIGALRDGVRRRDERFLQMAGRLIYEAPNSPYRALLLHAGWGPTDLDSSVRAVGVDATLERLRDDGVYITFEELKGRKPIVRGDFVLEPTDSDFDNPLVRDRGLGGTTSGSTAGPRSVVFGWEGLAEDAASNLVLREIHGIATAPLGLWLPVPPGVAGVHSVLVNAKIGSPPDRWFSPVDPGPAEASGYREIAEQLSWAARRAGVMLPRPEAVPLDEPYPVARWLAEARRSSGTAVLRTSSSSGVRVAEEALERGLDVSGTVVLAGGEPLTDARARAMEAAGIRAVPRYASAELGLMAGLCGSARRPDDMHAYLDRLAVTTLPGALDPVEADADSLLFTTLTLNFGKVFLNAELGDYSEVEHRDCGCPFGDLGMTLHLSRVRSHEKLTIEGLGLLASQLDDAVAACIARAGGGPNDYQFQERSDERGLRRLVLTVSPGVSIRDEELVDSVLAELRAGSPSGTLASEVWRQARTLQVTRAEPEQGYKMPVIAC
jgi:hypothetical protein